MNQNLQEYDLGVVPLISINQKFSVNPATRRLFISGKYRASKKILAKRLKLHHLQAYNGVQIGKCRVYMLITAYDDVDAFIKGILDSMQEAGIIANDRDVLDLHVTKTPCKRSEPKKLHLVVEEL